MGTMIASLRELLQDSWSMMKRTSEEANHYGAIGRLRCRVCLFLTNRQRLSRENVEYQSLTEIAAIFTKELKDGPPVGTFCRCPDIFRDRKGIAAESAPEDGGNAPWLS